ncbi:MAG TPA: CPBP family glutamic-type intramembrane protease [Pyrinomonadaceae bacterium]|nr:CPBP family glutamic-type intramembrane protease [Pyrinomonadaceae bacterium]
MSSESIDPASSSSSGSFPWRLFWLLLIAAVAGVGAAVPLVLEVFQPLLKSGQALPLPLPTIIALGIAQNLILLSVAIGVGLLAARKVGLGAPLLQAWLYGEQRRQSVRGSLGYGALVGIALGVVVLVPLLIAAPHLPGLPLVSAARAALWKRIIVGLYGGLDEEILSRLFLLSLFAWLGAKILRKHEAGLSARVFWIANIVAAILFGLGHLPSASMVMHITPAVVAIALILNGIPAVTFGYLYWRRGLESAMIAHFCADFVLYAIGPAFLRA